MRCHTGVLAACVLLAACGDGSNDDETASSPQFDSAVAGLTGDTVRDTVTTPADTARTARATLRDASGTELGTLTLTGTEQGIRVSGTLSGLPPGVHAIHLHTTGRCDAPAFESAGGHWNPAGRQHGTQNPQGPHAGDLPNFEVSGDGLGRVDAVTSGGGLRGDDGLLGGDGSAVMVHERADDYRTDPAGNAGNRIACGVVEG
jgi:Cu-Zn family superoxide dismutase